MPGKSNQSKGKKLPYQGLSCLLLVFILMISFSCKRQGDSGKMTITGEITAEEIEQESVREILYNLYQPEEMSSIFERVGANFNPDFMASPDNIPAYSNPSEIAIALGIYGVDLFYSRLFDQPSYTARYLSSIQVLSEKLGIPENYYEGLFEEPESWIANRDSVTRFAADIYFKTDKFLKKSNRGSLAALIVMGSWVEAMYIATRIYEENPTNMEIMDRIGEQKYSLNPLISLMSNYHDDLRITEHILILKKIRKSFDKFDIFFSGSDLTIDTARKVIAAREYQSTFSPENAREINELIQDFRMRLVR